MAVTTSYETGFDFAARRHKREGQARLRTLLSRTRSAIGGWLEARHATASKARNQRPGARNLTAISTYRDFIVAHPDMPRDHRDRFLAAIIKCCEDEKSGK